MRMYKQTHAGDTHVWSENGTGRDGTGRDRKPKSLVWKRPKGSWSVSFFQGQKGSCIDLVIWQNDRLIAAAEKVGRSGSGSAPCWGCACAALVRERARLLLLHSAAATRGLWGVWKWLACRVPIAAWTEQFFFLTTNWTGYQNIECALTRL
jgi:hypothetical protein